MYRARWPQLFLTPTALATHWLRVVESPAAAKSGELRLLDSMREEDR